MADGKVWSVNEVLAHAPDPSSVRAAKSLVRPAIWSSVGNNDTMVWGRCQGSGGTPYRVSVDLTGPSFACDCPSRKYPCKHALALGVLWASSGGDLDDTSSVPDDSEARRAGSVQVPSAQPPADPEARAARRARRIATMDAGMDTFGAWLDDVARMGLSAARALPHEAWDTTAARLVDAQLPGLADRLRRLASELHRRDDWPEHFLHELGRFGIVVAAWRNRARLDDAASGDLRAAIGWPLAADEVLARDHVSGCWSVLAVVVGEDERVRSQRTWLRADDGRWDLVLDFAAAGRTFGVSHVVGSSVEATVVRYPGSPPNRARFVSDPRAVEGTGSLGVTAAVADVPATVADVLARNPLADRVPVAVGPVTVVVTRDGLACTDDTASLPLRTPDPWALLARTGGHPVRLVAEWEDGALSAATLATSAGLEPL